MIKPAHAGVTAGVCILFTIMIFDKEFTYTWLNATKEDRRELHDYTQKFLEQRNFDTVKVLASHLRQKTQGNQLWVSKAVSDDLQMSDIDETNFAALAWPHDVLEFYFEDPMLPTFLFHRREYGANLRLLKDYTGHDVTQLFEAAGDRGDSVYDLVVCRDNGVSAACITLTASVIDGAVAAGFLEKHAGHMLADGQHDVDEGNALLRLLLLAYKVLLFASSEGCAPQRSTTKPTRAEGGKPGFKNRPVRPRMKVVYLPAHRKERKKQAAEVSSKSHAFNGRRGHWRVYQADRYVRMKGRRVFIYPVADANGNYPKCQFRVVRP